MTLHGPAGAAGGFVPYPGLRSFQRDETEVFFGRDGAVHDMLRRLAASRFLAVLGASGSGKSSLVRTGMLEGLEMGLIAEAGTFWRVVDIAHPGADPMLALARALCDPGAPADEVEQMRAFLLGGPRSLVEWAGAGRLAPGENLLLLIDQFEEIFRYRNYDGHQEAEAFVALILECAQSRGVPIYVTLTMRSEYLGACALFNGLAEAMNRGQYLTPRLGREECRAAIEGPAAICGFAIEPALVTTLLNDLARFAPWSEGAEGDLRTHLDMIGRRADQLPLLQHVLNRLWLRALGRAEQGGGAVLLTRADYETLGGLRGAIDQHAAEIAASLPPGARGALPGVFRALTTGPSVAEAVRRPTRLSTLAAVCGTDLATVSAIVEAYRAPGRNFLTPPPPVTLGPDTDIDISHESLIRQWTDLSGWLQAEAQDAESLRRLDEAALREEAGTGELLEGRALAALTAWRKDSPQPLDWAARYIRDPARAFAFLDRSAAAAARGRRRRRLRRAVMAAGVAGLAVVSAIYLVERNRRVVFESQVVEEQTRNDQLEAEKDRIEAGVADLRSEAARLEQAAEAEEARARRFEAQLQASRVDLLAFARDFIARSLMSGRAGTAADVVSAAALLPATATNPLAPHAVLPAIWLRTLGRPRADAPSPAAPAIALLEPENNLAPRAPFVLRVDDPDETGRRYAVVDRRSGHVLHRFDLPEDIGEKVYDFALSMTGQTALLRDLDGRLMRWEAGQAAARRVPDQRWVSPVDILSNSSRDANAVVFDEPRGEIGLEFSQYATQHFVLLPPTGAADAPIWRKDQVLARMAAAVPPVITGTEADPLASWWLRLIGLRDGAFLIEAASGATTRIVLVDMAGGTARQIGPDLTNAMVHRTSDPDRLTVVIAADAMGPCLLPVVPEGGEADPFALGLSSIGSGFCLGTLDLAAGTFAAGSTVYPRLMDLADETVLPLDPAAAAVLGGPGAATPELGLPPMALGPADAAQDWLPWIDSWRRFMAYDGSTPWLASHETRQLADGMTVWPSDSLGHSGLQTRDADIADGLRGHPLPMDSWPDPSRDPFVVETGSSIVYSADGSFALLSDPSGDLGLVRRADSAQGIGKVEVQADKSCLADAAVAAPPSGTGPETGGGDIPLELLNLVRSEGNWFLARMTRTNRHVLVQINAPAPDGTAGAVMYCPAAGMFPTLLGTDIAGGQLALGSPSGRQAVVWSIPETAAGRDRQGAAVVAATLDLPAGATAVSVAFLPGGRAVLGAGDGSLHLADTTTASSNPALRPVSGPSLPGLVRIQSAGNRLLLVQPMRGPDGPDGETPLVALATVDPQAATLVLTHAAALPLPTAVIVAYRPQPEGAVIEVLLRNGTLLRIGLPAMPPADLLADELFTLSSPDPVLTGKDAAELAIVRLLLSSIAEDLVPPPLAPAAACGARVEQAIAALSGDGTGLAEAPACDDPAALALIEAIGPPAGPGPARPFDSRLSALLARAAEGDSLALRAIVLRLGGEDGAGLSLAARGARGLSARLFDMAAAPGSAAYADAASGDALAQHRLARAALDRGAAEAAFRHAWIAEAMLSAAGLPASAAAPRDLRYAAGTLLTPPQRLAALAALREWRPVFAPAVPVTSPALDADLAALDRIAVRAGAAPEIALLKLARLEEARDMATPADRPALVLRAARLAAEVPAWPEGAVTQSLLLDSLARLRGELPAAEVALSHALDAAVISAVEADGPQLSAADPPVIEAYVAAMNRLLAAPAGLRAVVAPALRLRAGAIDFSLNAHGQIGPLSTAGFIARRGELAAAYPRADGAAVAAAAAPFWQAVVLWRTADLAEQAEVATLRNQSEALQANAFDALLVLAEQGRLVLPAEQDLLVMASGWLGADLERRGIRPETAGFQRILQATAALSQGIEQGGKAQPYTGGLGAEAAIRSEVAYSLANLLPAVLTPETRDQGLTDALAVLEQAATVLRHWQVGAMTLTEEQSFFGSDDWPVAPGYALVWAVAPGTLAPQDGDLCDQLAASPYDPTRTGRGVPFQKLKASAAAAVEACAAALRQARADGDPRREAAAAFLLGRARSAMGENNGLTEVDAPTLTCLLAAAEAGHVAALNNLAAELSADVAPFRQAYTEHILRDDFPAAHALLAPAATRDEDRAALLFFARYAADLGSGEANMILSRIEADPVERAVRRQMAAKILETGTAGFSAASLAELGAVNSGGERFGYDIQAYIDSRVANWAPRPLPDLSETLAGLYPDPQNRRCE